MKLVQVKIRLPIVLKKRLVKYAQLRVDQSLSAEIVDRLMLSESSKVWDCLEQLRNEQYDLRMAIAQLQGALKRWQVQNIKAA